MNDQVLELPASSDLPTLTLLVDGETVTGEVQLVAVTIWRELDRIPCARIELLDGEASAEDFPLSNQDLFVPGSAIEVQAGYHNDEAPVFTGIVVRHAVQASAGSSRLVLTCKDPAVQMTTGRRCGYHYDLDDAQLMSDLIEAHGLTAEVDTAAINHTALLQFGCSDWDLLLARAQANGLVVKIWDSTVSVAPPDPGADPVLTLKYGATLISLQAELDAEWQFSTVKARAWNPAEQAVIEEEGEDPGFDPVGNLAADDLAGVTTGEGIELAHGGPLAEGELVAWSSATRIRSRLAKARGRLRCIGSSDVAPGDVVELLGVGERFTGGVYISGVRHVMRPGAWEMDLSFGLGGPSFLDATPQAHASPAANLLPGIPGLHPGVVTALEGDPDGEARIRVRLPIAGADAEGAWARLATLDAGSARGTYFRPEIDDEVIVGFIQGDPRQPVILGGLHSSAMAPPEDPSDDNHKKGYHSREGLIFEFDDETKAVRIETPGGRVVLLDDDAGEIKLEDGDGNSVTLDGDGITLKTDGDLTLEASGDVKIKGANVKAEADQGFEGKGGSEAKVQSDGTTTIKGSMVMIN